MSPLLQLIYYTNYTKNIISLSEQLIAEHAGKVPASRKGLEALPGVGRKTANVILSVAFKKPTIAVDTHIFRVSNRTKIANGKKPIEVELELEKNVPKKYLNNAHHLLILHGRYICKAQSPNCNNCIIQKKM